jgi:hypothetical protein
LIRLQGESAPAWQENATLGVELHLPDSRSPLVVDAYYRGARVDTQGHVCVAVQFVGLEIESDGRAALHRLARCVQKFNRHMLSSDVLRGSGRMDASAGGEFEDQ